MLKTEINVFKVKSFQDRKWMQNGFFVCKFKKFLVFWSPLSAFVFKVTKQC